MAAPNFHDSYFKDCVDPADEHFRLVELKLPHDAKAQPSYGPFEYTGIAARERIRRFCAAFLAATGDITPREAERILRKSHAVDARAAS